MTYYYNGTVGNDYLYYTGLLPLYARGYDGNDTILGSLKNDIIYGDNGNDYLSGGDGNDWLYGGDGSDTLAGGDGSDILHGDAGNDYLYGGNGSDILRGGAGNDVLYGSLSRTYSSGEFDTLTGGTGSDIFVLGTSSGNFYQGLGYATITDFSAWERDVIQLRGSASSYYLTKNINFGGTSSFDTGIYNSAGDLLGIVLDNTSITLTSSFIFV